MTKLDDGLDPVVVAALIDDDDDEESKAITQEYLKNSPNTADDEEEIDDTDQDDDSDNDDDDESDDTKDKGAEEDNTSIPPEAVDTPDKEPIDDSLEDDDKGGDNQPPAKPSRKERRAERQAKFLAKIGSRPQEDNDSLDYQYDPLNIEEDSEYDAKELIADRNKFGTQQYLKGVQQQREYAKEESFWQSVETDAKLLVKEEQFKFLDPSDTENFDQKKSDAINNLYLQVIGYHETPVMQNGQPLIQNDRVVKIGKASRHDLSFDEFARGYMENIADWVNDETEDIERNVVKAHSRQGVRPGGSSKSRSIGKLKPGDISKMSDEEFEKHEAEIDRQIAAELGA